jgi:hypothetical protein
VKLNPPLIDAVSSIDAGMMSTLFDVNHWQ